MANLTLHPNDLSGILTIDFSRNQNGGPLLSILDGGFLYGIRMAKKLPAMITRTVTSCNENFYNIDMSQFTVYDLKLLFGLTAILWNDQKSRFANSK